LILTEKYRKEMNFIKDLVKKTMCMSPNSYERFCKALDDPFSIMSEELKEYISKNSKEDLRIEIKTDNISKYIDYTLEEEFVLTASFIRNIMRFLIKENILKNELLHYKIKELTIEEFIEGKYISSGKNIYKIESLILKFINKILPEEINKCGIKILRQNNVIDVFYLVVSVIRYIFNNSKNFLEKLSERSKLRDKIIRICSDDFHFNAYSNITDEAVEYFFKKKNDILFVLNTFFEIVGTLKNKKEVKIYQTYNMSDILLCSYGESWTSCLNIDSSDNEYNDDSHSYGYWIGLFNVYMNPSHSMFYVTDGSFKKYMGKLETHSFKKRTWLFQTNNKTFNAIGLYPDGKLQETILLPDEYEIINLEIDYYSKIACKYSFNPLRIIDDLVVYIYKDNYSLKRLSSTEFNIVLNSSSSFSYFKSNGVEIEEDLARECSPLTELYIENITIERFCYDLAFCDRCEESFPSDTELTYIPSQNMEVCNYCLNYFRYCDDCCEYYDPSEVTFIASEMKYVCDSCLEKYYTCDCCGDIVSEEKIVINSDEVLCISCQEEKEERERENE